MKLLNRLEKKFGKYAIKNLMYYIIMLYALGFVILLVKPEIYMNWLSDLENFYLYYLSADRQFDYDSNFPLFLLYHWYVAGKTVGNFQI